MSSSLASFFFSPHPPACPFLSGTSSHPTCTYEPCRCNISNTPNSVTERTVVDTIREIKKTINKVDNDWVLQHLTFFNSIEEIEDTECALGFRFGLDIYITSWMNFGGDIQWGIPGTDLSKQGLDGRPDYIRRTYGPSDGGMMIMPRRRSLVNGEEAPYEVMVRLATVDMETLLNEPNGLSSWAEKVID